MAKGTCSVEGCERPVVARGWCGSHWKRWSVHGDPLRGGPIRTHERAPCKVEGCEELRSAHGYCPKHYQRWKRHGDPLRAGKWTKRLEPLPHGHTLTAEELRIRHRSRMLLATYGISHEEYVTMAEAQGGRCAFCGDLPKRTGRGDQWLHVDHDHQTGRVRALLCFPCNNLFGRVERFGLERIAQYLAAS